MSYSLSSDQSLASNAPFTCIDESSSIFLPPAHGWLPSKLPELATNGFPFTPTFIVRSTVQPPSSLPSVSATLPFGFLFRVHKESQNQPVIDFTHGYYDPHTQVYTVPMRCGGDTQGGQFQTGFWTGLDNLRTWDEVTDYETD